MDVGVLLGDGVEQVEGADHVVDLGVGGVLAVDHRIRRRALLGEVHHGVGSERGHHLRDKGGVGQVTDVGVKGQPGQFLPAADPMLQVGQGNQAVHAHLEVVLPPGEVVHNSDAVSAPG